MTNRILMSASTLKVSLPGFDVTTAGGWGQLAFDPGQSKLLGNYQTGYVGVPGSTSNGPGSAAVGLSGFSSPPLVLIGAVNGANLLTMGGGCQYVENYTDNADTFDTTDSFGCYAYYANNNLIINNMYSSALTYRYAAFLVLFT